MNNDPEIQQAFAAIVPPDADAGKVGEAIVGVVDAPFGKRPIRVHIDPTQDGAEVAFAVIDWVRSEMLHRVGLDELLTPAKTRPEIPHAVFVRHPGIASEPCPSFV